MVECVYDLQNCRSLISLNYRPCHLTFNALHTRIIHSFIKNNSLFQIKNNSLFLYNTKPFNCLRPTASRCKKCMICIWIESLRWCPVTLISHHFTPTKDAGTGKAKSAVYWLFHGSELWYEGFICYTPSHHLLAACKHADSAWKRVHTFFVLCEHEPVCGISLGARAGNFGYFHSRDSKYFFGSSPGYPFC